MITAILFSCLYFSVVTYKTPFLPFVTCTWVSPNRLVAAGHNCEPMLFEYDGKSIKLVKKYDTKEEAGVDNVIRLVLDIFSY